MLGERTLPHAWRGEKETMMRKIEMKKAELVELCKAMSRMTPHVVVRDLTVELTQRPDRVIEAAGAVLRQFPEEEQKRTIFKVATEKKRKGAKA